MTIKSEKNKYRYLFLKETIKKHPIKATIATVAGIKIAADKIKGMINYQYFLKKFSKIFSKILNAYEYTNEDYKNKLIKSKKFTKAK